MNVLDPQYSRYINLREELEAYLAEKYGEATEHKMLDFKVSVRQYWAKAIYSLANKHLQHENDRWLFVTPEKLSKKDIK